MAHVAYGEWSGSARALALAVDAAVGAARAGAAADFEQALVELANRDREQLATVLGEVTRSLLERTYPDGLDADDANAVLRDAVGVAGDWYPALNGDALVVALTGSLGIHDEELSARLGDGVVQAHGVLLIAGQLESRSDALEPCLDAALRELHRAQTIELP